MHVHTRQAGRVPVGALASVLGSKTPPAQHAAQPQTTCYAAAEWKAAATWQMSEAGQVSMHVSTSAVHAAKSWGCDLQ